MENSELEKKLREWSYMNEREQDDYALLYGTRKQRKAVKERRKALEKEQPDGNDERPATLPVRWIFIGVGCDGAHTKFPPTGRF
ncbi:MAG: hypothetical protein QOE04_1661 [Mycobacterium sp.]|jgi:hypothetical protein|nr:hypothetical protein [Mycobacterium sp.]